MNENNLLLNQAFCISYEEGEKCHKDLGDGRKSYEDNDFKVFVHDGINYFVPEADMHGNNRTMNMSKLMWYMTEFAGRITTIGELPKVEV